MTNSKPIWRSKTFWTNAVALVASIASMQGFEIGVEQQGAIVGGVMAVVNIILRLTTKSGVTLK